MMRRAAAVTAMVVGFAISLGAQDRNGRFGDQGIPPGHLPPPGQCRVWYSDRAPGQQPRPTSCREAERTAARERYARVIYGSDVRSDRDGDWGRNDDRPRAVPRRSPGRTPAPYPGTGSSYPGRTGAYGSVAYDNGYRDGMEKGREDARDRDDYDPVRHGRYRDADRGYDRRYGTKTEYKLAYRDGFEAGYDAGYGGAGPYGGGQRGNSRLPWPF